MKARQEYPAKEYKQSEILDLLQRQQLPSTDSQRRLQSVIRVPTQYRNDIMSDVPLNLDPSSDAADISEECLAVCEAAAQRLRLVGFRRGNYAIAQKIGLFLKSIQSATPDNPSVNKQNFVPLLFSSYVALHTLANSGDIDVLSTRAFARIGAASPEVHGWLLNRKMGRLAFLDYELPRAFLGMAGDVWSLCMWVLQEGGRLFRLVLFGAAALIILIPAIEALGVPDMNTLTGDNFKLWKELAQTLQYEQVRPLALFLEATR
jgi:hypothetical protein